MREDASSTVELNQQQQQQPVMPSQALDEPDGTTSAAVHSAHKHTV